MTKVLDNKFHRCEGEMVATVVVLIGRCSCHHHHHAAAVVSFPSTRRDQTCSAPFPRPLSDVAMSSCSHRVIDAGVFWPIPPCTNTREVSDRPNAAQALKNKEKKEEDNEKKKEIGQF